MGMGKEGNVNEKGFLCVFNILFFKLVGECIDGLLYYFFNLGGKIYFLKVLFKKKSEN